MVAALWVLAAAVWSLNPVVGFCLLTLSIVLRWRRTIPTHVAVLAVPTAILLAWCALGQLLAVIDVTFLTSRLGWAVGWVTTSLAVLVGGSFVLPWLTSPRGSTPTARPVERVRGRVRWVWLPAGVFGVVAALQSSSFDLTSRWITLGTDPMQLVLLIQQMAREGALVITRNLGSDGNLAGFAYPKGLHWMITATLGPATDPSQIDSASTFELYVRVFAGFTWLAIAGLMAVATGLLVASARRWDWRPATVIWSGLWLLAIVVCVRQFSDVAVAQGALASVVAITAVWAVWWTGVEAPRLRILATVVGSAIFVTSNTWPPLAVVVAAAGVGLLWTHFGRMVSKSRRVSIRGPMHLTMGLVLGSVVVLLTVVPATGLLLAGGVGQASVGGQIVSPSLPVITAEAVLLIVLLAISRLFSREAVGRVLACSVIGLGGLWGATVLAAGSDVSAYYPQKVIWFGWILLLPLLATGLGMATAWLLLTVGLATKNVREKVARSPVLFALTAGSVLLLFAALLPWAWQFAPPLVAEATGTMVRPAASDFGLLPPPPAGRTYVPYQIAQAWDAPGPHEYIAAKVLAFRFGTPYMQWTRAGSVCSIIQGQTPALLVSTRTPSVVAASLAVAHCPSTGWTVLTIG